MKKRAKMVLVTVVLAFATVGETFAVAAKPPELLIQWGEPVELGCGGYARVHRLRDGRYMAAYSRGGDLIAQFTIGEDLKNWTAARTVARHFTATNGDETAVVSLDNAEFAQLPNGRIIYATNLRPAKCRHDIHPFAIAIVTSDDGGATWSPLRILHAPKLTMPADGNPHGCYEPFVLSLGGARAQIYFADETPYEKEAKCSWQEISVIETADGGETWSAAEKVCYTPKCRDGMPVVLDSSGRRYLAIEANPKGTHLHPQIVMPPSGRRFEPLAKPPDWSRFEGGAPYIAETENYLLLSWQERSLSKDRPPARRVARVAAVPKKEIAPDGTFSTMRGASTPPRGVHGEDSMLWNSLCPAGGDKFVLVSDIRGRIVLFPGRVR